MTALAALTERMVLGQWREDLPFAVAAPVGFFVVFHFALRHVIDTGETSYAQYLLPVTIVQVIMLSALITVDRAGADQQSEFGVRLRTLPISAAAPLVARMVYCMFLSSIVLIAAISVGYVFGFRIFGGFGHMVAFVVLVLAFTLALSLGADAVGAGLAGSEMAKSGTSSQLLLVPQLLLIMLSTGMAPLESFPDWLHPFVRYQPVSQVTETLRGFATGQVVADNLRMSTAWCVGLLLVLGTLAVRVQRRQR